MAVAARPAEPEWLRARRESAASRAAELELPRHRGVAGWEFTELRGLDLDAFPPGSGGDDVRPSAPELFAAVDGGALVRQVDATSLPQGGVEGEAIVLPLDQAVREHPDLVERYLGRVVGRTLVSEQATDRELSTTETVDEDPFVVRNDAEWTGGLFVYVPRGARLELPALATVVQASPGASLSWRTLVVLEEGAEAEVWEQYLSAETEGAGLVNVVTELVVGANARLRFVSGQDLNESSWIFASQRAEVERDGALDWVALGFGGANGKVRMETKLAGPGSSGKVTGAYAPRGRQHVDFDTTQEHAAPNTTSDLAFRGILSERSTAVWRGMIKVDPGAQQTDAFQESRNLLLSKRAHADAIPGLEILANDVRCTHAAAIAQIDPEQLFYLRSRGMREEQAKRLVIEGFMAALVERFEEGAVRDALAVALERRMATVLG